MVLVHVLVHGQLLLLVRLLLALLIRLAQDHSLLVLWKLNNKNNKILEIWEIFLQYTCTVHSSVPSLFLNLLFSSDGNCNFLKTNKVFEGQYKVKVRKLSSMQCLNWEPLTVFKKFFLILSGELPFVWK
jgi:hypothetical protein